MSGFYAMRAALKRAGMRGIDGRIVVNRALKAWRDEMVANLGGEANLTTAERTLLGAAVTDKALLCTADAWLLANPGRSSIGAGSLSSPSSVTA